MAKPGPVARAVQIALVAALCVSLFPAVGATDVHEQQTSVPSILNPYNAGLSGQVSWGQQLKLSPYVQQSNFLYGSLNKVQVYLSKTSTTVTGNVCLRVREPTSEWSLGSYCVPASSIGTTAGWVDFPVGGVYFNAGDTNREFWVDYDGTCTTCIRVYYTTSDIYRPGESRTLVKQQGPLGSASYTLMGGDLGFKLWFDHSPVIAASSSTNIGMQSSPMVGYEYRMTISISDNAQMPVDGMWHFIDPVGGDWEYWYTCDVSFTTCWTDAIGLWQHRTYSWYACGYNWVGGQCTNTLSFNTPNTAPSAITGFTGPAYAYPGQVVYFTGSATDPADTLMYEVDRNSDGVADCYTGYDYYSGDTGWVPCTFPTAGTYNVRMRARDNSPNGGTVGAWTATRSILVDGVAPGPLNLRSTTHTAGVWSTANDATLQWDEVDGGSPTSGLLGSSHRIDNGAWSSTTRHTTASYTDLPDGSHPFDVQVLDNAGNVGSGSFPILVDTTPPSNATPAVKTGTQGQNGWYTTPVQMQVVSADATSGVKCERYSTSASGPWLPTNDADLDTCSGIADWAVPADGTYTYYGLAKDLANLNRAGVDSATVKMDRAAPTNVFANITSGTLSNGWYKTDVGVRVESQDATSGIACEQHRLGTSGAFLPTTCAGQDSWTVTAEGTSSYDVRAVDSAGLETITSGFTVKVDKTPPTTAAPVISTAVAQNGWYTSDVALSINSADANGANGSGIACEQYGPSSAGPWTPIDTNCTPTTAWTQGAEGTSIFYGRATDVAGWTRSTDSVTFKIDKTPPTVTDNQADKTWTNTNPVLNVDFGDARSGIWTIEYAIYPQAGRAGTAILPFTPLFSTTTDGTGSYTQDWQVNAGALAQGSNYVSVRVTDRAGLQTTVNDVVKIQWDTVQPTKANPVITTGTLGTNSWYTTDVGLAIDSADATAGVASEWHAQVIGQWFGGSANDTWTNSGEGTTSWYGRAVDQAGNEVTSGAAAVKVDKTLPVASSTLVGTAGDNGWYRSNVDATVTVTDTVSGANSIATQLDGAAWVTTAATSKQLQVTGDAIHTLGYYAKDNAGLQAGSQAAPYLQSIKIDRAGPVSSHALAGTAGTNGWYTSSVDATITSTDATSGPGQIWYQVDGGSWQSTTAASKLVSFTTAGIHSLNYYAVDLAGNADGSQAAPKTVAVKIDLAAPTSSKALAGTTGTNGWYKSPVTVTLTATDATSGVGQIQYGLDPATAGTTPSVYSTAFTIGTEGTHALNHRAVDGAGRTETVQQSTVKIDLAAPDLSGWTQTPSNVDGSQSGPVAVSLTVNPGPSGVASVSYRYSYDNGALWSAWSAATAGTGGSYGFSIPAPSGGWWNGKDKTLRYEVAATDGAGNSATAAQTDFVDRLAPTVTLLAPWDYANYGNGIRPIQFQGRDADHDLVAYTVRLSPDGGATWPTTLYTFSAVEDGTTHTYTYNWDTRGSSSADGSNYAVKVEANDGLYQATAQHVGIVVDNTAPGATLVSPAYKKAYVKGTVVDDPLETRIVDTTFKVQASADDGAGSGIQRVEFRIDGVVMGTDTSPDAAGLYDYTWTTTVGKHSLSVQSYDYSGNPSARFNRDVTVVESQVQPPSQTLVTGTILG